MMYVCAHACAQCVRVPGCVEYTRIWVGTSIFNHLFNSHELFKEIINKIPGFLSSLNKSWTLSSYIHILLFHSPPAHSVAGCLWPSSHWFITVRRVYDFVCLHA